MTPGRKLYTGPTYGISPVPHGQTGKLHYADGRTYQGGFVNGQRHGRGQYWASGCYYEGDWLADAKSGTGKLVFSSTPPFNQHNVLSGGPPQVRSASSLFFAPTSHKASPHIMCACSTRSRRHPQSRTLGNSKATRRTAAVHTFPSSSS